MLGAIEAGGTKFVLAVSDESLNILDRISISTTNTVEVFTKTFKFFDKYNIESIGIGSFGPIDINNNSETYGYITSTPKTNWNNFNFLGRIKEQYPALPIAWTTDVNASAYGELNFGAARNVESCMYITVGTGIGGGLVMNKKIALGFQHPEVGHIIVHKHPKDEKYTGFCPYHKNCLEGLAAGPSIANRWGKPAIELQEDEKVWELEAYYLAQAIYNYFAITNVERFILGGGVMKQTQLFPLIRKKFIEFNNNYLEYPDINDFIVAPELGDNAAIMGCLKLASELLR